jgi:hypothetical protein
VRWGPERGCPQPQRSRIINTQEFKLPLSNTLEDAPKGDAVVMRATDPLAIHVKPR